MSLFAEEENHRPLHYWKGHALWLTTWVAIAGVASMAVTALLGSISRPLLTALIFNTETFLQGTVWSIITYPFLNVPDFWFFVTCYMLWQFGSSVEQHLGRRSVAILMFSTVLVLPLLCFAMRMFTGSSYSLFGMHSMEFAIFIAFATLYPNAMINIIVMTLPAWVFATVIVSISALSNVMSHNVEGLLQLLLPAALAYLWVKRQTGSLSLPQIPKRRKQAPRGAPAVEMVASAPMALRYHREPSLQEQIDVILDKISEKGMGSLNDAEKKLLERHSRIQQQRKKR